MVRRRIVVAAAALVALTASGCADVARSDGKTRVVAAFYPLEMIAARVGGDSVSVVNLTPAGAEPHDLELRPSDLVALRSAAVVFYLGGGFQPAVEDAVRALPRSRRVDLLAGLALRDVTGHGHDADPHVWLDPTMASRMARRVGAVLAARIPTAAVDIERRVIALTAELASLDAEFARALATCRRDRLFTAHAAFGYLADRYGLRQVAIAGLSPESEPAPRRLNDVARQARAAGATTIFFETLVSPRVAAAIARHAGAHTAVLNPLEGLTGEERDDGIDYFSAMRANLAALVAGLGCGR